MEKKRLTLSRCLSNYDRTVCLSKAGLQFANHVLDSVALLDEADFGLCVSRDLSSIYSRPYCLSRSGGRMACRVVKTV